MLKFLLALIAVVVVAVGIGVVALLAFGGDDDEPDTQTVTSTATREAETPEPPTPTPEGELTASQVLEEAAERTGEVESFHFVLTHENGSTPLPLNLDLQSAEGDIVVPDRMQAEANAEALGINVSVDVIGIEGRTWVTNPFTRQWQELPDTNIRDFADPAALIRSVLPAIEDPELSDGGEVDGVDTHLVTGTINSQMLQEALGLAEAGNEVTVEAWIGKEDTLARLIRLEGPLSDEESPDVVREVEISQYNEPVEIMPPE